MPFDTETVKKVAHLARLHLPEAEVPLVAEQLERILAMVEEMRAVPTEGVESMAHPLDISQPLRPDEVLNRDRREVLMARAPQVEDGLYIVPRVVE